MADQFLEGDQLQDLIENLVDRNSETLNFPDKTYALGGAGKKIAFEMLETDWFLTELLLNSASDGTDFHIIDTQTETIQRDRERKEQIETQISKIEGHLQEMGITNPPRVRIELAHLTEEVASSKVPDFINDDRVEQILQHAYDHEADTWWVDKETLTDSNGDMNNLAKGAIRRRALSKAFFYKAQSESTTFANDHLNLMNNDSEIALIAGLGGGTGSGMFIDLARYIADDQDNARITMFGILPSSTEGPNERANAHAALAEMEHLSLSNDENSDTDPFSDIILTPIEATEHQPNIDENPKLENFDSAFSYVPISYYNNDGIDALFDRDPEFAPFTIAVPQVFRYNVKEIKQNRDKIKDILESKSKAQNAEERLYSQIETFYNENYGSILAEAEEQNELDEVNPTQSDRRQLRERIDLIKEFATDEMIAGSNVVDYLENIFDLNGAEDQTFEEDLNNMQWAIENTEFVDAQAGGNNVNPYIGDQPDQQRSELEEDVISQINGEMHRIIEQYRVLKKKELVANRTEDEFTASLISFLLDVESGQEDSKEQNAHLSEKEKNVKSKISQKKSEKESLREKLEDTQEEQQDQITEVTKTWTRQITDPLNRLDELESLTIKDEFRELERTLKGFTNKIRDASRDDIDNKGQQVTDALDALEEHFHGIEVSEFDQDRREIETAIENVCKARKRWIAAQKTGITDFIPIIGGNGATSEYDSIASTINSNRVFSVPGDPKSQDKFQVNFVYEPEFVKAINKEKEAIRTHLIEKLNEAHQKIDVGQVDPEILEQYKDTLKNYSGVNRRQELKQIVKDSITNEISDIKSIQEKIETLDKEISEKEDQQSRVQAAKALFSESAEDVMIYRSGQKEFRRELQESSIQSETTTPDDNEFTNVVSPNAQETFQDDSLSEAGLLENTQELGEIQDFFAEATEDRLLNSNYHALVATMLETQDKTKAFDDTVLNVSLAGDGFVSNTGIRNSVFDGPINLLQEEFGLANGRGNDRFGNWSVNNGGPWDIAMCMFIQGITFMDNMMPVVSPKRGYLPSYDNDKSSKSRVHRHAYGLERGFFVNRKGVFPVNDNRDMFVESSEQDLVEKLLSEHETVSIHEYIGEGPTKEAVNIDVEDGEGTSEAE